MFGPCTDFITSSEAFKYPPSGRGFVVKIKQSDVFKSRAFAGLWAIEGHKIRGPVNNTPAFLVGEVVYDLAQTVEELGLTFWARRNSRH